MPSLQLAPITKGTHEKLVLRRSVSSRPPLCWCTEMEARPVTEASPSWTLSLRDWKFCRLRDSRTLCGWTEQPMGGISITQGWREGPRDDSLRPVGWPPRWNKRDSCRNGREEVNQVSGSLRNVERLGRDEDNVSSARPVSRFSGSIKFNNVKYEVQSYIRSRRQ